MAVIPAPRASAPCSVIPAGACDAHSHLFGPLDRYPLRTEPSYAVPEAGEAVGTAVHRTLGTPRIVFVQAAPYGDDPALMLDAVARAPRDRRAVAVAPADVAGETLARWRDGGVCALRFVEPLPGRRAFAGSVGFDAIEPLAPLLIELGMHVQLWAGIDRHVEVIPRLLALGLEVVVDHMGNPDITAGAGAAAFEALLGLLDSARVWIKLTTCRLGWDEDALPAIRRLHDAFVERAPERMIWGSDWPFVNMDPPPDAATILDRLVEWAPGALSRRILVDNPCRLFGFGEMEEA